MKNKISLSTKITSCIGIMFLFIIISMSIISIDNLEKNFINPVSNSVPAVELIPTQSEGYPSEFEVTAIMMEALTSAVETGKVKFNQITIYTVVFFGLLGTIITYLIVQKTLQPLKQFTKQVQRIDQKVISNPINLKNNCKEMEQLNESFNKMLQRLEDGFQTQKRFASAAAHELKTPLASIKTNIEVMNENPTKEEFKEVIDVVKRQVNRLNDLVNQLLAFSQNEKIEFENNVSTSNIINQLLIDFDLKMKEKNIKLTKDIEEHKIRCNEILISRALSNCIENAIKYSSVNQPEIIISCRVKQDNILFVIEDNGIGIGKEEIKNIFEPFYRVDSSRSRSIAGSGLGLSLVKEIVEKHQGKIEIESVIQKGTKVTIMIPNEQNFEAD